jgi:hypothetical protein
MKRRIAFFGSALLAIVLSACGSGGGSNNAAPTVTTGAAMSSGSAVLLISAVTPSSVQRNAAFVSPSASSVGIAVNGGTAAFSDISSTSTLCTTVSGGRSCTVPFTAAAGTDSIVFTLYAGASGSGAVLGSGTAAASVVGGQSFTVAVSIGGVVAKIVVTEATALAQGAASNVPVTVSAQDSSGNTIIGPALYSTPITLTDSDTSGATTLTPTQVRSPSTAVTLAYTGGTISGNAVTISATANTDDRIAASLHRERRRRRHDSVPAAVQCGFNGDVAQRDRQPGCNQSGRQRHALRRRLRFEWRDEYGRRYSRISTALPNGDGDDWSRPIRRTARHRDRRQPRPLCDG